MVRSREVHLIFTKLERFMYLKKDKKTSCIISQMWYTKIVVRRETTKKNKICGLGGIGRRARFRSVWETVGVRIP